MLLEQSEEQFVSKISIIGLDCSPGSLKVKCISIAVRKTGFATLVLRDSSARCVQQRSEPFSFYRKRGE